MDAIGYLRQRRKGSTTIFSDFQTDAEVEKHMNRMSLMGRYHLHPRTLSSDYEVTNTVLGQGCSGQVQLAKSKGCSHKKNEPTFAVKTFQLTNLRGRRRENLKREVAVFLCLDHPHIARLVDVYESEKEISLVMECISGGELFDRVTKLKRFSEKEAAVALRQILLAVNYLHSQGIIHRDLKLENFLYDDDNSKHLKLIDFGFSRFHSSKQRLKTTCGTLAYVAPEVLEESYDEQADAWSIGVIAFVLLSGTMPFYGSSDRKMEQISAGEYRMKPDKWSHVSDTAKAFVQSLLSRKADVRLTVAKALEHSWIQAEAPATPIDPNIAQALQSWHRCPKLHRACMCMMVWSLSSQQHAKMRDQFLILDRDHDGTVSFTEFKLIFGESQNRDVDEAGMRAIFDGLQSSDGRGVTYSDFLAAVTNTYVPEFSEDQVISTFRKFDVKNSGHITADDLSMILGASFEGGVFEEWAREAGMSVHHDSVTMQDFKTYMRWSSSADCYYYQQSAQRQKIAPSPSVHSVALMRNANSSKAVRPNANSQDSLAEINSRKRGDAAAPPCDKCCSIQ